MTRSRAYSILGSLLVCGVLTAQAPPPPPPPPAPPAPPEPAMTGHSRVEKRTEKLAFGSKLWVKNRNGGIRITGWDREEVALTAEIRDSERRKIELIVQRKGEDLDIEALFQQSSWTFGLGFVQSPRCEMTLSVPRKLQAHFRTTNGTLVVSAIEGFANCETTNGDIRVKEVAGEVHADTTNGTIEARNLRARIRGGTTNGKILLQDVEGGIKMETTNGSIRAQNLDGWGEGITLETTNGSIDVELGKATGEIRAENTHGNMDVRLPGAQTIELTKHSAHLKVPGKPQKIVLDTTNGSITIR
ncbi:MAG: DUF4097 family beta strand repeat-containing protein [Holophaga sp.]